MENITVDSIVWMELVPARSIVWSNVMTQAERAPRHAAFAAPCALLLCLNGMQAACTRLTRQQAGATHTRWHQRSSAVH